VVELDVRCGYNGRMKTGQSWGDDVSVIWLAAKMAAGFVFEETVEVSGFRAELGRSESISRILGKD
jgi:hypothetical protein